MNLELFFSFKVMFFPGEFNTCSVFQSTCCKYSSSLATPFCIYLFLPLYISKLVNIKCDLSYIFFFLFKHLFLKMCQRIVLLSLWSSPLDELEPWFLFFIFCCVLRNFLGPSWNHCSEEKWVYLALFHLSCSSFIHKANWISEKEGNISLDYSI